MKTSFLLDRQYIWKIHWLTKKESSVETESVVRGIFHLKRALKASHLQRWQEEEGGPLRTKAKRLLVSILRGLWIPEKQLTVLCPQACFHQLLPTGPISSLGCSFFYACTQRLATAGKNFTPLHSKRTPGYLRGG